MIRQRIAIGAALVATLLASACGGDPTRSSAFFDDETLPVARPSDPESPDTQPIPPTTVAEPVASYTCDDPLMIAENLLLERRQGSPASNCADADPWLDSPDDFVDFTLDASDQSDDSVRFVAIHRTSDTTSEQRAETLEFEQGPDGAWRLTAHEQVDLADELADARSVATEYFDALGDGDRRIAAGLLAPTAAFTERPDLDRLEADGLLADRTVDDITAALDAWCGSGAACDRPDDVEFEITPDHRIRIVATYDVGPTGFDVAFDTDGVSIVGIPPTL